MTSKVLTPIVLPADPAAAMEAATKQYVDNKIWIDPTQPASLDVELWYDTDAPSTLWNPPVNQIGGSPITWRVPNLVNGWTNYGQEYETIRYGRRNGHVYVQGLISHAGTPPGPHCAVLDSTYVPARTLIFTCGSSAAGVGSSRVDMGGVSAPANTGKILTGGASYLDLVQIQYALEKFNGIEYGFEGTWVPGTPPITGAGTLTIGPGAAWVNGVRVVQNSPTVYSSITPHTTSTRVIAIAGTGNVVWSVDPTENAGMTYLLTTYPLCSMIGRLTSQAQSSVWLDRREWI